MTIKEKIDAYVLAQGNQVGAGAELASLLKEIVDSIPGGGGSEPLIVEGKNDGGHFEPNEGQASHDDAIEAFRNGTLVFLDIVNEDTAQHIIGLVTSYDTDEDNLYVGNVSW